MVKRLRKAAVEPPATPYLAARREWNERYGDYIRSASNWRLAAIASLAVAIISSGGLVAVALQAVVVPYAVELNGAHEVVRVQRADVLARPDANQLRAALRNWVIGARTVYSDPAAVRNLIDATYALTAPDSPAYQDLAGWHKTNNPYQRAAASETVGVDVRVAVPVSADTWQVEWTETTKQPNGKGTVVQDWQGTFTVLLSPPQDAQQIMLNPLGLYVRQFAWTARLGR